MGMSCLRPGFALSRSLAAAVLTVTLVPSLHAQSPQPQMPAPPASAAKAAAPQELPSARSIIDRHLAAIGGRAAVQGYSSTRATGVFSVAAAGMNGTVEIAAAKPDKSAVRINLPGVGEIFEGYNGKHGWTLSAMTGPMLLDGKQLEDKRFDADFYAELRDESRFQSITTVERADFDGRPCYKVRLVRKNGTEDFEYYDVATGLKAGRIVTRESPMGTVTATSVETDYKKFGKLLLPTTVKQSVMGVQQVITIQTVEFDTVPPSAFEPPAEIKALIK